MVKNRLLVVLKNRNRKKPDGEISQATSKIESQKRLSTQEFLKVYEAIWQDGPSVNYHKPGAKERELRIIIHSPYYKIIKGTKSQ